MDPFSLQVLTIQIIAEVHIYFFSKINVQFLINLQDRQIVLGVLDAVFHRSMRLKHSFKTFNFVSYYLYISQQ